MTLMKLVAGIALVLAIGIGIWLHRVYLLDGLDGALLKMAVGDSTEFAPGYSDRAFATIRAGMETDTVLRTLGPPLSQVWVYTLNNTDTIVVTADAAGSVHNITGREANQYSGLKVGVALEDVRRLLGDPARVSLVYSRPAHDSSYRVRSVVIRSGKVERLIHDFYWD